MSVDHKTVKRIAHLARIAIDDDQAVKMTSEINDLFKFVEQLNEVNVEGIEPMVSVAPLNLPMREDKVTDGDKAEEIFANSPLSEDHFFLVPKVVE